VRKTTILTDHEVGASAAASENRALRLAEGTELLGEYQDAGYQTPKYLICRADGQVLQLPRLLYLLAGALDGRDTKRIATSLSAELGQDLTAEHVTYLIEERLRPAGLLGPDGTDADGASTATAPTRSDPLLALRYRVGVASPRISWRIAGVFGPLFARPAWIAALAAFVTLDLWVVLQGDLMSELSAGATTLIRRPELTLVLLALLFLSMVFHECGHVTACRYGGARPGIMGIGLYLVWPALYSTVTDAYRLDRVGRLRTDLGGVYFNAIFMAGLTLAYLGTGAVWLLPAMLLMHVQVAWQFVPSLRFDGYYMLADLVGVPELFSYVGPALKSLMPGRPAHPRVRELRPRSRRLIVLWVALTIPTLLFYLGLFLLLMPRVLPQVWAALLQCVSAMQAAARAGDVATVTLGVVQLLLLLLPWVGSALVAVTFLRMLRRLAATRGWGWAAPGRGSTIRRYAALIGVGTLAGALVWRVAQVAGSTAPSTAETQITTSAVSVLHGGHQAATSVATGEGVLRDQLAGYAYLTDAFGRHADAVGGGRELAVLACGVLVACFLTSAVLLRWRLPAVALPLAAVAASGPAVSTLATLSPAVVGVAWTALGATALAATRTCWPGRRHPDQALRLHRWRHALVGAGAAALGAGLMTAPLLALPLAVGAVLLVAKEGQRLQGARQWVPMTVGAFVVSALAALTAPALLRAPVPSALSHAEQQVLLLIAGLAVIGAITMHETRSPAVAIAPLVLLAALPEPGTAAILPLLTCCTVVLGALLVRALTRQPVEDRPHPLLRAALTVPLSVLVIVGTLL
jgi:putative peptide zinc metalloprotease protein